MINIHEQWIELLAEFIENTIEYKNNRNHADSAIAFHESKHKLLEFMNKNF